MSAPAPSTPEPEFDAHALTVLEARYLLQRDDGHRETPREMLWRVARTVAAVEAEYGGTPEVSARAFYDAMAKRVFLPNSPTLRNAGWPDGQLSACFVLPVEDSLDAIFDSVKNAARIHGTGGGTGFSFSRLRPKDDPVNARGRASGPVAFMKVFDAATAAVHQGGVRRGANMGILRVDHPDIRAFLAAKRAPGELSHFNISVAVTDAFMQALRDEAEYALINPRTGEEDGRLEARAVWDELVDSAWATGDPGLVFIDRINALQPTPDLGAIESTNPCGEQPLLPYESCNLGSIDVSKLRRGDDLDWDALRELIHLAVRFLDDVIDANHYPIPAIDRTTRATRKIGLGVMGWADLLIGLGIPYASQAALDLADRVAGFVLAEGRAASAARAESRGPFPAWEGSRRQAEGLPPLRNATVTTVAPTGTISLLAGCSSGIEPLYALAYTRRTLDGTRTLEVVHPLLEQVARARGCWSEALAAHVASRGTLAGAEVPDDLRALFATAHEIAPAWHVKMQAAFQRHVEAAVSKTINLPREATRADVDAAFRLADELGCKGITVYRDGCRAGQVLSYPACGGPECPEPQPLEDAP